MTKDQKWLDYVFKVRVEEREKALQGLRQYKRKLKAKIKLYYDNGNFDYQTVMNIIKNI